MPINYEIKKISLYSFLALVLYGVNLLIEQYDLSFGNVVVKYAEKTVLFALFAWIILQKELKGFIPAVLRRFKR